MNIKTLEVTATKIYCRRPVGLQIGLGVAALLFGGMCFWLIISFWPSLSSLAERSPVDTLSHLLPSLLIPVIGLCFPTAIILYNAGPADLILDTDQRTYRFRRGFPLLASWKSGSFGDFGELRVSALRTKSTSSQLLLDWNNTQASSWTLGDGAVASRRPFLMGVSKDSAQLLQEAHRLAQQMGVQVQENKPDLEQARQRTLRQLVLVSVLLFLLLSGLPPVLVARSLETQGQATSGKVTQMNHGRGYSVHYTYEAGGSTFQGRASVPWPVYENLNIGSTVPVRFLPAYPHTSTVVGSRDSIRGMTLMVYGGLLVLFILVSTFARAKRGKGR